MRTLNAVAISALVLTCSLSAQMIGGYTVNPVWPSTATNFVSLFDATTALTTQGVSGPVLIDVFDDAGPYTEASPFVTVNGPYPPNTAVLVLGSWIGTSSTARVTFRAAAGENPVFDAAGRSMGVFWGGADYVTLQGFEIRNAIHDAISLYAEASHGIALDPIIDGCRLHDCGGTGVTIYGNSTQPANTLVQNCAFWRLQLTNAGSFNTTGRFGYVTTRRSNGTRIVHNTFFVDAGVGSSFCVFGAYPSGTTEVPYAEISNNAVFKVGATGLPIFRINGLAGSTFPVPVVCDSNCFFDATTSPFALYGTGGTTVAATLLDWQLGALRDLASLYADPLFANGLARDFHLQVLSPCLSASTVSAGVTADADGQPRLAPIDIGADEFSAATFASVGTGCPGTGSLIPVLRTDTWPFLGNPEFALTVEQVPAGLFTILFGSLGLGTPIPFGGGCTIQLNLGSLTSLAAAQAGPVGTTSFVFPVPGNPVFIGVNLTYQSLVLDPGAALGLTMTNALDVVFDF